MHSLGIPPERVVLTPYWVDNQWWIEQGAQVNRSAVAPNGEFRTTQLSFCLCKVATLEAAS